MKNLKKQIGRLRSRQKAAPKGDGYRMPGSMNAHKGTEERGMQSVTKGGRPRARLDG
jgi:hypothetical protein